MRLLIPLALVACGDNRTPPADTAVVPSRCEPARGTKIVMRQVAKLDGGAPVLATAPAGDARLFVVVQDGRILILENGELRKDPFLDLSADANGPVVAGGERGLLGLAFHPSYATNGTFFVFYTTLTQNVLARYQIRDAYHADPIGTNLIEIEDKFSNHNGGMIEFGPDGMLYVGTGDGGGTGDPDDRAKNPFDPLGKMLRIDVDGRAEGKQYGIPVGNPFADGVAGAPEVYMIGLRNPWRWSIDRGGAGDFWIGDVGQGLFEEVDHVPAAIAAGADLGWSRLEGRGCFKEPCDPAGTALPAIVRTHEDGWCSVIGGQTYEGDCFPDLRGTYFYTDYCAHRLEGARVVNGEVRTQAFESRFVNLDGFTIDEFPVTPSSIHADGFGELHLTTVSCCGSSFIGAIYRLEATR